jgi:hypothetical protein
MDVRDSLQSHINNLNQKWKAGNQSIFFLHSSTKGSEIIMILIGKKIGGRGNAVKEEVVSDEEGEVDTEIKIKEEPKVKKPRKKSNHFC